jgi:hypothetical protein
VLTIIVGAILNIQNFCRFAFLNADRKSKVANDVSYIVEHVVKFISNAAGDTVTPAVSLTGAPEDCDSSLLVWTDSNGDGYLGTGDTQVLYCFNKTSAALRYYANYTVMGTPGHDTNTRELVAGGVTAFTPAVSGNKVNLTVTTCWKPFPNKFDGSCGTPNNPSMTLRTSVPLLSVSADLGS